MGLVFHQWYVGLGTPRRNVRRNLYHVKPSTLLMPVTKMMLNKNIKFPMTHVIQRPAIAAHGSTFKAKRPSTIFG